MKNILLSFVFTSLLVSSINAQELCPLPTSFAALDINNVRATYHNAGSELTNQFLGSGPGYEVPKDSGIHSIYASAMWLGGLDASENIHMSIRQYMIEDSDWTFRPGPMNNVGPGDFVTDECAQYDIVFKINRSEVALHRLYFEMMEENGGTPPTGPPFESGYTIPNNILNWPVQAEIIEGQPQELAPYFDDDCCGGTPGIYEPELGDYPAFKFEDNEDEFDCEQHLLGDQVLWWVVNDAYGEDASPEGFFKPFGMEVHNMAYAFISDGHLNNTTFIRRTLINRSGHDYHDVFYGDWTDGDLGNPNDDYYGSDVERGLSYFYNGDNFDENFESTLGYGTYPPAIGFDYVGGPLAEENDGIDNNFNGTVDEPGERHRMDFSMTWHNYPQAITGDPQTPEHYYNYINARWKNGFPLTYGGDGYNPDDPDTIPAQIIFPGDSDPLLINTNGIEVDPWTEASEGHPPGDRRNLMSSGPFTFAAGDVKVFTKAIVWAREEGCAPYPCSVDLLREADDLAQEMHDNCYEMPCMVLDVQFDINAENGEVFFSSPITSGVEYHWTFGDGTDTTTATPFASHEYTITGDIEVCLEIDFGCGTSSNCQTFDAFPTSIEDQTASDITLYPNPANDVVNIQFSGAKSGIQSVQIYDLKGQLVHEQTIELSGNNTVNIKSLDSGMYLLQINDDEEETHIIKRFAVVR